MWFVVAIVDVVGLMRKYRPWLQASLQESWRNISGVISIVVSILPKPLWSRNWARTFCSGI